MTTTSETIIDPLDFVKVAFRLPGAESKEENDKNGTQERLISESQGGRPYSDSVVMDQKGKPHSHTF